MKYIFIVDPGHRKDTPGKSGNGLYEYEFNEDVARRLERKLSKHGEVHFTIESDTHPYSELTASGRTQNLNYRTTRANNVYWDAVKKYGKNNFKIVFISIHANAFSNPSVSGYEIFVYKHGSEAHKLAKAVHRQAQLELGVGTSINDRGVKEANFYVLKNTIMPAILVEHEFYTNPEAAKKLKNSEFRERCATHLYKGTLDYMGIKYDNTSTGGENVIYRVRQTWEDSKSQKGAYSSLNNAITEAKKYTGYKVYDDKGNQVYPETKKEDNDILYRVQVGVFKNKKNADNLLDKLKQAGFNGVIVSDNQTSKNTSDNSNSENKSVNNRKSKYYKIGDAHIIETTPDNIKIEVLGNTLHNSGQYGINGTFFDTSTAPVNSPNSCVFIAMNDGKVVSNNAQFNGWNAPPRATLIYHTTKKLGFRQLQNINSIRNNTIWAIGGYMVKPYMDFKNEKIPNSINYKTAHTYIGYDKNGKIYLIAKPNHMIKDIVPLMNQLNITNAIVLDGGGSTQLNHPDGKYTSSRRINTAILLKEV